MLNTQVQTVLSSMDGFIDVNIEVRFFARIVTLVWFRFKTMPDNYSASIGSAINTCWSAMKLQGRYLRLLLKRQQRLKTSIVVYNLE
jgi:hypothetical protein